MLSFELISSSQQQLKLQCSIYYLYKLENQHSMGNQYILCQKNTQQETTFLPPTIQTVSSISSVKESHQKTLQQFLDDNANFFANDALPIMHVLMTEPHFQSQIAKFPFEISVNQQKVFLPSLTNDDFAQYQGQCIILNYEKAQIYIGSVKNGKKSGHGITIDRQGNKFNGQWARGLQNGQGTYQILYPKRVYKGEWENGKMQGEGSAVYQDGAKYQGSFRQGKKNGLGVLTFLDGATYDGSFCQDLMHGYGTLTTLKGRKISGEWKNGKYQNVKPQRSSQAFSINQLPAF